MEEHKIQSNDGPLSVTLQLVPKMLKPLVSVWGPNLYVISFKLETDEEKLMHKCEQALIKYKHNLVIGNLLKSRRSHVVFVSKEHQPQHLSLNPDQVQQKIEIETLIVKEVVTRYNQYINSSHEK